MFQHYVLESNGEPAALVSLITGGPALVRAAVANATGFADAVNEAISNHENQPTH